MPRELKKLLIKEISLVKRGADQDAHITLAKTADSPEEEANMTELPEALSKALDGTELSEEQKAALAALFETTAAEVPEGYVPAPEEPAEGAPATPAPVAEAAEPETVEMSKEFVDLQKELEDTRAEVAKMREEAEIEVHVAKAAEDFPTLSNHDELGAALYRVEKSKSEEGDAELIRAALLAAAAQVEAGALFTTVGKSSEGSNSVAAELETLAKELQTSNPSMTTEKAQAEILKSPRGQELWAQRLAAERDNA